MLTVDGWEGKLLVATPLLTDPAFARSVVQLVQHDADDGALGLVLNRPTAAPLDDSWALLAPAPVVLFEGGPVQQDSLLGLGRVPAQAQPDHTWCAVDGAPWLAVLDLSQDPSEQVREARLFSGYAGWSVGQLEDEVAAGAWWVVDALPGDAFSPSPELLWRQVLRRQPAPLALAASYPTDPTLN